jgi:ADP-ribosylglycohydrolase
MYGAIIGDTCGSIYEFHNHKTENLVEIDLINRGSDFTDDTVLTVAIANAILNDDHNYKQAVYRWANKYPDAGYGGNFYDWFQSENPASYNSWGNGSAMRVSSIGWAFDTLEKVLDEAKKSAECTHNHPEGITIVSTQIF